VTGVEDPWWEYNEEELPVHPSKMEEIKFDRKQDRDTKYKDTKTDYDLKCM